MDRHSVVCIAATALLLILRATANGAESSERDSRKTVFYVAPDGSDAWSGTVASPDSRRSDGPFATPVRAVQAVRALLHQGITSPVSVFLRGGTYELDKPLTFSPDDSGTTQAPVTYASYPGEKAILSGGRQVGNWRRLPNGHWQTVIPEVADGKWYFEQLFVNGQRRFRPRLPKGRSCYYVAAEMEPTSRSLSKGYDRFRFQPGQLRSDWRNLNDIEVLTFHIWTMSRLRVADIDNTNNVVTMTGPTRSMAYYCKIGAGQRFLLENVREALTEAGEWYLDRGSGELTYSPMEGEFPGKCAVTAPRLEQLVCLQGDPQRQRFVEHLVLRDLEFSHTNWTNPATGYHSIQAEANLGGAITARGARNIKLDGCRITHTGE